MLQHVEPVDVRTLILVRPVPTYASQKELASEPPENVSPESSFAFPLPNVFNPSAYTIGPIDPAKLIPVQVQLSSGTTIPCFIPPFIPLRVLMHPFFREGCEWGYIECDPEEEVYTFPKLLNDIFGMLSGLRDLDEPEFCPWTIGFVLGELARLTEVDRTLALTGLAHYCFILSFLSPGSWGYPFLRLSWASAFHLKAMKAYRARIRSYREQGKSFEGAQRLALCYSYPVPAAAFKCVGADDWPLDI